MNPVFFLGTGRNGTLSMTKLFQSSKNYCAFHEFKFEEVLKLGFLYHNNLISESETVLQFENLYVKEIRCKEKKTFLDASNALTWLIKPISQIFPEAKFVHLTRNGRRVVSSFFHKFESDMYPMEALIKMHEWGNNGFLNEESPSLEKKYWRVLPRDFFEIDFQTLSSKFADYRFFLLCNYWSECNEVILKESKHIAQDKFAQLKAEGILTNRAKLSELLDWLDVDKNSIDFEVVSRPINVHRPVSYPLTNEQEEIFSQNCKEMMHALGYEIDADYVVKY